MISFDQDTIVQNGSSTRINKWDVWFQTPFGLIQNLADAVACCKAKELDPDLTIQPVPVALDSEDRYEVVVR